MKLPVKLPAGLPVASPLSDRAVASLGRRRGRQEVAGPGVPDVPACPVAAPLPAAPDTPRDRSDG